MLLKLNSFETLKSLHTSHTQVNERSGGELMKSHISHFLSILQHEMYTQLFTYY